ncbi:MAG: pyridine nucleotide-disulfide oxidoreductase [Alphaproteobacteria bacterium]|nr:pyridine nucleotide-disulfide oxidoreductase [Alphaproteobacteria bacterium]
MIRTDVAVIGAGQAGLAMSACLSARGIDHVVIERARIAERWRNASWDSLRLLTPNWLNELPGWRDPQADPDAFMGKDAFVDHLTRYAAGIGAPVQTHNEVLALERIGSRYRITASRGTWESRAAVIATGHCQSPLLPPIATRLSPRIFQLTAAAYRRPDALPAGGVLVIGASASGIQIAEELHRSGRKVTLSVGRHTRLPRRYRGHDIFRWLDRLGMLDELPRDAAELERARQQPSLQLTGGSRRQMSLSALRDAGVRVVGRAASADATTMTFAGDLAATTADADERLKRLLERIDGSAASLGIQAAKPAPVASYVLDSPAAAIDFAGRGISTVIWATGYRRSYPWLALPVRDAHGEIAHEGGVTAAPGLYVMGLRWMRRRSSSFIAGTGRDAAELAQHVADYLERGRRIAA